MELRGLCGPGGGRRRGRGRHRAAGVGPFEWRGGVQGLCGTGVTALAMKSERGEGAVGVDHVELEVGPRAGGAVKQFRF